MSDAAGWTGLAPALRSRNFRLFWLAQIVSTIGTSLQVVAEGYLIYQITESTFWLGAVSFFALIPVIPISFLGGVLIDRVPRRRLIMWTQLGLMLQAVTFGVLALNGRLQLWNIILLYFWFGAVIAIDHPARRAFLVDIVDRPNLANAIALNATLFNVSNLVGFALAGLLIAAIGAGGAMVANSATYILPIVALGLMRVNDIGQDTLRPALRVALSEGILTLWRQPLILATVALMAVVGGLAYPVYGMMPAYAEEVMDVGSIGLGILLASAALGAVLGTAVISRIGQHRRGRNLTIASILLPLLVILFSQVPSFPLACLLLVAIGMLILVVQSLAITLVQINVADRVRGRVMSLFSMLHAGSDTGGNLVVGSAAVYLGLPVATALGGVLALLFALGTLLVVPGIRRLD